MRSGLTRRELLKNTAAPESGVNGLDGPIKTKLDEVDEVSAPDIRSTHIAFTAHPPLFFVFDFSLTKFYHSSYTLKCKYITTQSSWHIW